MMSVRFVVVVVVEVETKQLENAQCYGVPHVDIPQQRQQT